MFSTFDPFNFFYKMVYGDAIHPYKNKYYLRRSYKLLKKTNIKYGSKDKIKFFCLRNPKNNTELSFYFHDVYRKYDGTYKQIRKLKKYNNYSVLWVYEQNKGLVHLAVYWHKYNQPRIRYILKKDENNKSFFVSCSEASNNMYFNKYKTKDLSKFKFSLSEAISYILLVNN